MGVDLKSVSWRSYTPLDILNCNVCNEGISEEVGGYKEDSTDVTLCMSCYNAPFVKSDSERKRDLQDNILWVLFSLFTLLFMLQVDILFGLNIALLGCITNRVLHKERMTMKVVKGKDALNVWLDGRASLLGADEKAFIMDLVSNKRKNIDFALLVLLLEGNYTLDQLKVLYGFSELGNSLEDVKQLAGSYDVI